MKRLIKIADYLDTKYSLAGDYDSDSWVVTDFDANAFTSETYYNSPEEAIDKFKSIDNGSIGCNARAFIQKNNGIYKYRTWSSFYNGKPSKAFVDLKLALIKDPDLKEYVMSESQWS